MKSLTSILACAMIFGLYCAPLFAADSSTIRREIFEKVDEASDFGPYDLEIDARAGRVVLEGTVASQNSRQLLEQYAWASRGVSEVDNRVVVDREKASQAKETAAQSRQLATAVRSGLQAREDLDTYNVNIRVSGARVVLEGTVSRAEDIAKIERSTLATPGVESVSNQITVARARGTGDLELAARVRSALASTPDLTADDLDISADNGIVTITGMREDHRVRDRILSIALNVDGVRDIRSKLEPSAR